MHNIAWIFLFFMVQAYACQIPTATTTVYYLPDAKKMCGAYGRKCSKFVREVRMQGSGKLYPNKVYRYTGRTENLGDCDTAKGARNTCLTPYISVAADRRQYNMGDIISMPGLKGRTMTLKNGKTFKHPGYLIVEDTGGAIKGRGRFDFFTDMDMNDSKNSFGYKAKERLNLADKRTCSEIKKIASRIRPSDAYQYKTILKQIRDAVNGATQTTNSSTDDTGNNS